jgi:hypothetical protein
LLTEPTGNINNARAAEAWIGSNGRPLVADSNDIVEYQDGYWQVTFFAAQQSSGQYVTNITTEIQYEWNGSSWVKSYQGAYPGGTWRLVL